jgi:spermidine synthase
LDQAVPSFDQTVTDTFVSRKSRTGFYLILLILFAASGCAALIYEVVWYQLLQLAIGSTSVSMGILLATYMGGLCIGSLWLPRLKSKQHPLRVYAGLEAGIAAFGLLVLVTLPLLNSVYVAVAADGLGGMLMRGFLAACCMLPPTILMGASLPAIVRWIEGTPEGVSWWGFLYGGNTLGAVAGCLVAGFWLLRIYNMTVATWAAVAINLAVAAIAWLIAPRFRHEPASPPAVGEAAAPLSSKAHWAVYLTIGISGATALGAEIVWTRLLGMLLLGTVYVFAIILAVFLTGLALGSAAGSWLLKRMRPMLALGWCQVLLAVAIVWTALSITQILPEWTDDVLATTDAWRMYLLDLKRVVFAILPGTLFWGASFPLACAALAERDENSGRTAGAVYAANTLGGIVGALIVSLSLIPAIGTQQTQQYLLIAAVASGLVALFAAVQSTRARAGVVVAGVLAGLCWFGIPTTPGDLIAYGRQMGVNKGQSEILYVKEGRNSSVAISRWNNGTIYVNVNGHVEATTEIFDMKLQRMVGHLPGLLHPNAKSVLGIGFGAGVSAGTFTRYPNIEKIRVCEIEPAIPPASTRFFGEQDYRVALNPKTRITFDDARHYLMTSTEKFDIIASDPLDVFVKGTAALYSREYFEAVKRHLNPGGYFTLYVPLYETDEITMRSELATFFEAFPYGTVWANNRDRLGYDTVFMGQLSPLKIDLAAVERRYAEPDMEPVRQSLRDIGINSVTDLFSTFAGEARDLKKWTDGAPLNTDNDLRLSYLAGWGINANMADDLYRKMLVYRKPPTDIFSGPEDRLDLLSKAISDYSRH